MKSKRLKIFCFDIDNVICTTKGRNYFKAQPKKKVIKTINNLYENGHYIKVFTARFMGWNRDNKGEAKRQGYKLTLKQLKKWNVKYHKIFFSKPSYDYIIDDKSIFSKKIVPIKISKKLKKYIY